MSYVKNQHYLARKHMSWFANADGTSSVWWLEEGRLQEDVDLTKIGAQKYLYESDELPQNFVEKDVLGAIEREFFEARERIVQDKLVRRPEDRMVVKRYAVAQFLRYGPLHKRLVQFEKDLRFIAGEMGTERLWNIDELVGGSERRRASTTMAKSLVDLEGTVKFLGKHMVVYVDREESDLLLPDHGFIQIFIDKDEMRLDGFKSPTMTLLVPIAPNAALKIVRPGPRVRQSVRERMDQRGYEAFLQNLALNSTAFVVGQREALTANDLSSFPGFDTDVQRLSMLMTLYRAGVFDEMVEDFWKAKMRSEPFEKVRIAFYRGIFVPAVNKLFNPNNDPNAVIIPLI